MKQAIKYIVIVSLIMLSSCQLGRKYSRVEMDLPDYLDTTQNPTDTLSIANLEWWEIYSDTCLQELIYRTLDNNKDIQIAAARVKEMAAMRRIDVANLFPQIGADLYAENETSNYGGDSKSPDPEYGAKLGVSWELDIWGNLRWARDESTAEFLQSIEAQNGVRISLISAVAQAYFELVALDNELHIVRQTLEARAEGVHLAKLRYNGGLTSETSYLQAEVEYARTATYLPQLERLIAVKESEIAFLVGGFPQEIERNSLADKITLPETLPVGLPSSLLERRPDIREAEQRLIAANAAVGVAYTNRFPKLSITAKLGLESNELATLLKSPLSYISADLLAPLFAMGKNRAKQKASEAAYEQECYRYEKAVLNAFKEVYNSIVSYNKMREIRQSYVNLERSSRTTTELAQLQYINGAIGYLDLLDAQRSYFDAQISISNAIKNEQLTLVQLYKSLGGGW